MILKIFGLALLGAVITFILKAFGWRGAPLVAIATMIALLMLFSESFEKIYAIFDTAGNIEGVKESSGYLLKILGIGYLSGICSDVCKELGEPAIASVVVTLSKLESLLVLSPLILEIMTLGLELVK